VVVLAVAGSAPFLIHTAGVFAKDLRLTRDEASLYGDLDPAIAAAGGPARGARVRRDLHGPLRHDGARLAPARADGAHPDLPLRPGTAFAARRFSLTRAHPSALSRDPRFRPVAGTRHWVVRRSCGPRATS
jgi:hypothetical protein